MKQIKRLGLLVLLVSLLMYCSEDETIIIDDPVTTSFVFKESLSEYGFFTGALKNLTPTDNVHPYDLSTPLFSDYTLKDRFIYLPDNTTIGYQATGIVDFPEGTIIIKNFSSLDDNDNPLRLETRLLVLDPFDSKWKVMAYLWNDQQTEATKHITGKNISIKVRDNSGDLLTTNYHVPNTNDCKRCHVKNGVLTPIGPKIRALNFVPQGETLTQLEKWDSQGVLTGLPGSGIPVLPNWLDDTNFSLDERARAYLDENCAHCHTQGGDAFNTGLFLEYEQTDSAKLGFFKIPVSAGPGSGGLTYDVVPGNADESILLFRMNSTQTGVAMPELARSLVHEEGVALIREWINSF
ncbi:MAG: SO2930 family diheme c-type cytochrome [Chitinophagales bacterium]